VNRALASALAIASLAVAAACGGGGGGSHSTPAAPATTNSGATADGKIVLMIPNAAPAANGRTPQFVSSAAVSATVSINGGTATVYDLTAASSNCAGGPASRTCTLAITSGSGSISVTIALFDLPGGTGHNLGSATGTATVTAPTPFSMTIDINPAIKLVVGVPAFTFANGLPTITYKQTASGTLTVSFADGAVVTIPSTNTSQFQTPVTLTVSDPHITLSPSTINNASQTVTVTYDGSPGVASTYTITMKTGITTIASIVKKTAGFLTEFAVPAGAGSQPSGIAAGPDGNIWFTEFFSNNIGRVNIPANTISPEFPIPTASTQPFAIAAGPAGDHRMWFSEGAHSSLGTIDTTAPVPQESPSVSNNWRGVTSFGGNTFYLDGNSDDLEKYNQSSIFAGSSSLGVSCNPNFVAVGPDNMLWVTCNTQNAIHIVDPTSLTTSFVGINPFNATGIAGGPDNAVWFAETSANKIGRIAVSGQAYTEFSVPTAGSGPTGITKGPDGAMWFTEAAANQIGRIDVTTHQIVEFPVTTASGAPAQIIAGPDGWLWFTEFGTGKLGRMQPPT
jgi:streptogramin lyase